MRTHLTVAVLLLASCQALPSQTSTPPTDEHAGHSEMALVPTAKSRLTSSPRHQEWVEVKRGNRTIHTWVVYPQVSSKAPVVLLIHENRGLNDWVRSMADEVAEAGYIAVAPDLLSDFSPTQGRTSDFADEDAARTALGQLKPDEVQADLQAVLAWAKTIPAANGKLVSAGFCWGGSQSFRLATESQDLAATLVFYGTGPTEPADYARITSPVYGFYGGADERVNATIDATKAAMAAAGRPYDAVVYEGAGHAFMRLGEDPAGDARNVAARAAARERMLGILKTYRAEQSTPAASLTIRGVHVTLPAGMTSDASGESNRRGSFASYDLRGSGISGELQLLDAASLAKFLAACRGETLCFEGFYYDQARFDAVMRSLASGGTPPAGFEARELGGARWLVRDDGRVYDGMASREYVTRTGEVLVSLSTVMPATSPLTDAQRAAMDAYVASFTIRVQ